MARGASTVLKVSPREPAGSRAARRLRRAGQVPGVIYGGDREPVSFQVAARELRHALAEPGAVLEVELAGGGGGPAVVKELARHPISGETIHVDLLRVRLDRTIQASVALELTGADDAPGVRAGGVLEHMVRELTIEALPTEIPDSIAHDVSAMQIGETLTVASISPPPGVTVLDDPETILATITPPRLQAERAEEIETETELVGEQQAAAQQGADGTGGEGEQAGASDAE
ncbi:MAG TPA: 50S ribosomal protein L25 [Solirubrobacteraceae bacterium]|nr:50S ribosomal protein L25 [Solirubrobacteraceae bacterium]